MTNEADRLKLVHILHMAFSGEKAAGYAYAAHWRSVSDEQEQTDIRKIENEEWEHRAIVGRMLSELGARPQPWREIMMTTIGRTVGISCYLIGWFMPMYFAGRLESANVKEYEHAAVYAEKLGLDAYVEELTRLSAVEHEHEMYFRKKAQQHPLYPVFLRAFPWKLSTEQVAAQQ